MNRNIWTNYIFLSSTLSKKSWIKHTPKVLYGNKWYLTLRHRCLCNYPTGNIYLLWWRHQMETFSVLLAISAGNSPVPHKGQWRGALMFPLNCVWIIGRENNRQAGDLRRYGAHYDVIVMIIRFNINKINHGWVTISAAWICYMAMNFAFMYFYPFINPIIQNTFLQKIYHSLTSLLACLPWMKPFSIYDLESIISSTHDKPSKANTFFDNALLNFIHKMYNWLTKIDYCMGIYKVSPLTDMGI